MAMDNSNGNIGFVPENVGEIHEIAGAQPAAGAIFDHTLALDYVYLIQTVCFQYDCDANVATREFYLMFQNAAAATMAVCPTNLTMTANQIRIWTAAAGGPSIAISVGSTTGFYLPNEYYVKGGYHIVLAGSNHQAGDQYSGILILTRRWRTY